MYLINKDKNKIEPLEEVSFKAAGIRERKHLQEWIAETPQTLGEDLLIIQKEFSGFAETNERLDLLALDKKGNLILLKTSLMIRGGMLCGSH
jgi:RecB family endonuclease NucS